MSVHVTQSKNLSQSMDHVKTPPFETHELRAELAKFLDQDFAGIPVGNYIYGAYAFFDYDGEPIYVGQTKEKLRTRIRRHLTNQRTDAVAMSVLDPFEVYEIEVWPLPQFQDINRKSQRDDHLAACEYLDALEFVIYQNAIGESKFNAVLNEKPPPKPARAIDIPETVRGCIVSQEVQKVRGHPDIRIARRALTLSKLAQVISERQVQAGLRQTLLTQSKRLAWLAERRYEYTRKKD